MRRNRKVNLFVIALLTCIGLAGIKIYSTHAEDRSGVFDELLVNNEYVVYTEDDISNAEQLRDIINYALPYVDEYDNQSSEATSALQAYAVDCVFETLACDFVVQRSPIPSSSSADLQTVKTYENVRIVINSSIDDYFPMISNGVIEINYDEGLFLSDEEKNDYINSWISRYDEWDSNNHISYSYDSFHNRISYSEYKDNVRIKYIEKEISDIEFNYSEGEYSDDFKKLTSGTLTIKTDMELSRKIVEEYVRAYGLFSVDSNIVANKAIIKLTQWNDGIQSEERHLVDLVKDSNIDLDLFARVNLDGGINISADTPENIDYENDIKSYVSRYFNLMQLNFNDADNNIYEYYDAYYDYDNFDLENCFTIYVKRASNNTYNVYDVQIHKTPVQFSGYIDSISEDYSRYIGSEVVINADSIDSKYDIDNRLPFTSEVRGLTLNCNQDKTLCDIALRNGRTYEAEIHPITIRLDNTISDDFRLAFNLDGNDAINIIADDSINTRNLSLHFYKKPGISYRIEDNKLTLQDYNKGIYESHLVNINTITGTASEEFSSIVNANVEIYPGKTSSDRLWGSSIRNQKELFADSNTDRIYVNGCDSGSQTCAVALRGSNNQIEIHNSNIILKDGKSPQYSEAFPSDNIAINAINYDDGYFVEDAARAYFLGKTKTNAYLDGYSDNKAKLIFDSIESHSVNIEFSEKDDEIKAIVDEAVSRLDSGDLSFEQSDLEFINGFYYGSLNTEQYHNSMNYNSQSVQERLNGIIDNEHISYFLSTYGGGGTYYSEGNGGRIVLYYDGIAYGETETPFMVQRNHIIYIPDDTPDSSEDYIEAAQKRVDDYLGSDSGVLISYGGEVSAEFDPSWNDIDEGNFDGNDYVISRGGSSERILIVKDSSKMQEASFVANDVYNNVTVSSDDANYPTNTVVSSDEQDTSSPLIRRWLEMLGLDDASIIDINLFSPSIGLIKNFSGVNFDVQLPIDWNKFKSKNLYAYYISDDGKIEEHPITYGGFFGRFKTGHFSTYIISEKIDDKVIEDINNPGTRDNGMKYVIMFIASATGVTIAVSGAYVAKKKRQIYSTTA